jgi:preprotein translocase subunit SecY
LEDLLTTQVRRVRRIVRKIDSWTVFKVSAIFWLVSGLALILGFVMFWSVIDASGIPDSLVETLTEIGLFEQGTDPFADSERFLRIAVFGSITWSVIATGLTTLAAVMYNLISDIVGGVEFIVLEESLQPVAPRAPYAHQAPTPSGTGSLDLATQENPVTTIRN